MSSNQSPQFSAEERKMLFGDDSPTPSPTGTNRQTTEKKRGFGSLSSDHSLSRFIPVVALVVLMWAVEIVDAILPLNLDVFSLQAWNPASLYGLVTSPLLHSGFGHLMSNTFPFIVLGIFIAVESSRRFWLVTIITALVSGLGAWLTTFPGNHIVGASGIVFGYFGYLAMRTWFTDNVVRKIIYFAIGLFVMVTYGASMLFGMLPQANGISWQGHLFGFIGGVIAAWFIHRRQSASAQLTTSA